MATLFVIQGRDQGRRYELAEGALSVGRDPSNRIQLRDTEVSRRHAEVRLDEGRWWLVDQGSSNGSFVNSERVTRRELKSGDRVLLGRTMMIFTGAEATASALRADEVDIVGQQSGEVSRILRKLPHDSQSDIFGSPAPGDSPWLARARSNLEVMYRTALAVSHTLDIDQLLDRILELIFEWVESDRGCVMLVDRESGELRPLARRNRGRSHDDRMLISRTILDYVLEHKEGVLTSDAREDQRWDAGGSIVKFGVREAICVPMQGRYDVVGVIYIDTFIPPGRILTRQTELVHPNKFTEEHLRLMVAIGHQAALAVEDTTYYSAMVQAERLAAMGQTIAMLSHHIKNIMQGIRGGAYLVEEGLKSAENDIIAKGWRIVEKNQDKISHLVLDMLSLSKPREPELTREQINNVAGDVVELMQARAEEYGVALEYAPAADMPECFFDSEGMHRAILNVVTNAIDACEKRERARVVVRTEYQPAEGLLQVTVEDNGAGISPEDCSKIFQLFESRKGARGTGLGLPVSQKICREHGGDIRVTSEPGVGSLFTLAIPVVVQEQTRGDRLTGMTQTPTER